MKPHSYGREWIFYIPEFDALVIARPDRIDLETGNAKIEWGYLDFTAVDKKYPGHLVFKSGENCFYVGDLS